MARDKFKRGDKVKCVVARDERNLEIDQVYLVIADEEDGIFPDRPFVTILGEYGPVVCHASRFEKIE